MATSLLSQWRVPFHLVSVKAIGWPVLSGRNLLLLGAPDFSLTARHLLLGAPFSIAYDGSQKDVAIAGQGKTFIAKRADSGLPSESYGLITVRPSEGSSEGGRRKVVISGLTSAGSQAAMRFLTSASELAAPRKKICCPPAILANPEIALTVPALLSNRSPNHALN